MTENSIGSREKDYKKNFCYFVDCKKIIQNCQDKNWNITKNSYNFTSYKIEIPNARIIPKKKSCALRITRKPALNSDSLDRDKTHLLMWVIFFKNKNKSS